MKNEVERRAFTVELRDNSGTPQITGYPVVFNSLSMDMWGFREKVAPGAFKKTLSEQKDKIRALWNHDTGIVMGRMGANLELSEDDKGLAMVLSDPVMSDEQRQMMTRDFVNQMSFGFQAVRDQWEENRDEDTVTRTLLEVRLFEVSVVTFPASEETSASLRAIDKAKEIRNKFLPAPEAHTEPGLPHFADHRRMSLAIAERIHI